MKKLVYISLLLFFGISSFAQNGLDVLVIKEKNSTDTVKCKIVSLGNQKIKYTQNEFPNILTKSKQSVLDYTFDQSNRTQYKNIFSIEGKEVYCNLVRTTQSYFKVEINGVDRVIYKSIVSDQFKNNAYLAAKISDSSTKAEDLKYLKDIRLAGSKLSNSGKFELAAYGCFALGIFLIGTEGNQNAAFVLNLAAIAFSITAVSMRISAGNTLQNL